MNKARDMRPLMAVSVKMATAGILFFDRFLSKAKGKPRTLPADCQTPKPETEPYQSRGFLLCQKLRIGNSTAN